MTIPTIDPLLRSNDVRLALGGISRATLCRWVNTGRFPPPLAIGDRNAWPQSQVERWIDQHQRRTPNEIAGKEPGNGPKARRAARLAEAKAAAASR